jgi:CRP-like cAMP-binding protein
MARPELDSDVARIMALKALPAFAHLEADDLAMFASRADPREFAPGTPIFGPEEGPQEVHLVVEGRVREERSGAGSRSVEPYALVAPTDVLAGRVGAGAAWAEGPVVTLALERELLLGLLEENFDALLGVAREMASALMDTRRRLGPRAGYDAPADAGHSVDGDPGLVERILRLRGGLSRVDARLSTVCRLALETRSASHAAGAALWSAGDPADHAVFLLSGRVRCISEDAAQRFECGSGAILGLEDSLAGQVRWYSAAAAEPVQALLAPTGLLIDLLEDDPPTAVQGLVAAAELVSELLDQRAEELDQRAEEESSA